MNISKDLDFDLESLPMDVYDLAEEGVTIDSLSAGHGIAENGASCCTCGCCSF
jgi:hypothetical protein